MARAGSSEGLPSEIPDQTVRHRMAGEDLIRYALVALFAIVLYFFVLYPLLHVIWRSLLGADGGFVGLANYRRYFGTPAIAASIWNSLAVSLVSMVITVALAFGYAYGLTRTLMRCRGLFRIVAMLPLFAPSLVQALAFIYVFGNNGIFTRATGYNVGIYGAKGIVVAEVFYCFPHALLILVAALAATDARLYDAARTMGASPLKTFVTVTLPGIKYGLVSACFVVFTLAITDFGAPKAIGGKFSVMATEIYNQVSGQQNFTMGATVSVVLLVPAVLAYVVEKCRTAASGPLYLLSVLPVSVPGMVLGLAYIFTFNAPGSPLNALYGTLAILIISHVIHYFTVGFLTATTALKQMDAEFENVGASLGVPFYRTFWRVTVPIALPAIIAISMYFFLNAMVTLSAVVFLVAPGTELAAVAVLLMDDAGDAAQAAAMSVCIIALGLAVRLGYWGLMRGVSRRARAWLDVAKAS